MFSGGKPSTKPPSTLDTPAIPHTFPFDPPISGNSYREPTSRMWTPVAHLALVRFKHTSGAWDANEALLDCPLLLVFSK